MKKFVFTTTLRAIRAKRPCADGWSKLLSFLGKNQPDDEPVNLLTILESNGVQDMLWALQCVEHPDLERVARLMACDFAEAVLPIYEERYPNDKRPRGAIAAARRYALGKATKEEMGAAESAARAAAEDAVETAARAASRAAAGAALSDAAWAASWAAAWDAAGAAAGAAAEDAARAAQALIINRYLSLEEA